MTVSGPPIRTLSADHLGEVLRLLSRADRVELKLGVPETAHRSAVQALGMDPFEAQTHPPMFFDTPELTLNQARRGRACPTIHRWNASWRRAGLESSRVAEGAGR